MNNPNPTRRLPTRAALAEAARNNPHTSLVEQVFLVIAGLVHSRQLAPGTRLPSVRQVADELDVSRDTAARAYERLVAHGVVEPRRGSGYYAKAGSRRPPAPAPRVAPTGPTAETSTRWRMLTVKFDPSLRTRTGSGNFPDSWLDEEALSAALRATSRQGARTLSDYSDLRGYLPLRQQLQVKLQEMGILADVENIVATSGATEALHLIAQVFLRPGQGAMVESPGPGMLVDRLLSTGIEIHRVPRLADGPDLEVLRQHCERHRPTVFFCSSVLQNPTCTQIAPHKSFQLLKLAEEFEMMIVEDDTYGDLMPNVVAAPLARLATLDQLRRVIYVGSFSKTVAPGLRCGFLAASPERIDWLSTYRAVQAISGNNVAERVMFKILSGGAFRKHCEQLRNRLAEARPQVVAELQRWGIEIDQVPEAGMYLWGSLGEGVDSVKVAERMLEQGHLLAPGRIFLDSAAPSPFVRFNIAQVFESSMLPALGKLLGRRV